MSELKGKITWVSEEKSGTNKEGKAWKSISFVVEETTGEYPQSACLQIFGEDKVNKFKEYNNVGDLVNVKYSLKANEYKGNYYTNIGAWSVFKSDDTMSTEETQKETSDLPF